VVVWHDYFQGRCYTLLSIAGLFLLRIRRLIIFLALLEVLVLLAYVRIIIVHILVDLLDLVRVAVRTDEILNYAGAVFGFVVVREFRLYWV
jgi:hypothetical protein